jgi:hypothetical protein
MPATRAAMLTADAELELALEHKERFVVGIVDVWRRTGDPAGGSEHVDRQQAAAVFAGYLHGDLAAEVWDPLSFPRRQDYLARHGGASLGDSASSLYAFVRTRGNTTWRPLEWDGGNWVK